MGGSYMANVEPTAVETIGSTGGKGMDPGHHQRRLPPGRSGRWPTSWESRRVEAVDLCLLR